MNSLIIALPGELQRVVGFRIKMQMDQTLIDDHAPAPAGHNLNNYSVVVKLVLGNITAMLTGDIEMEAEQELVSAEVDLHSHILKIAHQGSTTRSSTMEFLEKVRPETAIIKRPPRRRHLRHLADPGFQNRLKVNRRPVPQKPGVA